VSTEQEYDAQSDAIEDQDQVESGLGPYPEAFPNAQRQNQQHSLNQQQQQAGQPPQMQMNSNPPQYNSMTQLLDPYDPIIDMDPFGLSASMSFPTSFSYDTSSKR